MTDKTEDKQKEKKPKIHGSLAEVTDENADELEKTLVEKIRKIQRSKGHWAFEMTRAAGRSTGGEVAWGRRERE